MIEKGSTGGRQFDPTGAACQELGIAFVPFSPLGRGFLTGAVTGRDRIASGDWRTNNPRFAEENLARNLALLRPLEEIGQAQGKSPSQVALAWVLSRGEHVLPIPGMKRRTHLEENVAAVDIGLTTEELVSSLVPGQPGSLEIRRDGTLLDGHHRISVLAERSTDIHQLPREIMIIEKQP